MTMQIRTAAGNSRKREANEVLTKYQSSGNDWIVKTQTWDVLLQKHRDVTGENECINWQNAGLNNNDDEK